MKKELCGVSIMLLLFLIAGICWAGSGMNAAKFGGQDWVNESDVSEDGETPQWTFIFYLAADNEQEAYADASIDQLEAGTANVSNHPQILYLIDRLGESGTEVFNVDNGTSELLTSYAEQNTADRDVLKDFATYSLNLAAHENVAFVMKSEGLSWRGIGRDNTHDEGIDDQLMPTGDLAEALIEAQNETGQNIDLLVLEGSIMAFIEVVYELRDAAPILLATQSKIQPDGLPWEMVIKDLGVTPGMDNEDLGKCITDNHIKYYEDKGNNGEPCLDTSINFASMTVFDLSYIDDVRAAHCAWAETTWPLFDEIYNILPHARDLSDVGGFGEITDFDYQSDIKTFMDKGLQLIDEAGLSFEGLEDIKSAVQDYQDLTYPDTTENGEGKLIVYFKKPADGFKLNAANGLSIWYPPTWNKYETRDESDEVFGSTMYYEDPDIGLDWAVIGPEWITNEFYKEPFIDTYGDGSNWTIYLFEYFDRADANLAGNGIGAQTEDDEPPKTGLFEKIGKGDGGVI